MLYHSNVWYLLLWCRGVCLWWCWDQSCSTIRTFSAASTTSQISLPPSCWNGSKDDHDDLRKNIKNIEIKENRIKSFTKHPPDPVCKQINTRSGSSMRAAEALCSHGHPTWGFKISKKLNMKKSKYLKDLNIKSSIEAISKTWMNQLISIMGLRDASASKKEKKKVADIEVDMVADMAAEKNPTWNRTCCSTWR